MDPPTLVCFDWGGVILRICDDFHQACDRCGIEQRPLVDDQSQRERRHALVRAYEIGQIGDEAFFEGVSGAMDRVYSPSEIARAHDAWLIGEFPRIAEIVDGLHDARIATALLSNTNRRHWLRREHSALGECFPVAARVRYSCVSHLVGAGKPDEVIYRTLEERAQVTPGEVQFFDDREENVAGARAYGWSAVRIDPTADPARQIRQVLSGQYGLGV